MEDEKREFRVGTIGDTLSGKTVFISCLEKDLECVIFSGSDQYSNDWLKLARERMGTGLLVAGTDPNIKNPPMLEFLITGPQTKKTRRNSQAVITAYDLAGVHYRNPEEELLEFLHTCQGYIILIDLMADVPNQLTFYDNLFGRLLEESPSFRGKRLSVCLSKYDDPEVLQRIDEQKLLIQDSSKGLLVSFNNSQHQGSIELLGGFNLVSAKRFITKVGILFGGENIRFFSVSSIGFYRYEGTIELGSCNNLVILDNGESRLRNGRNYTPVNLEPALTWAMGGGE